MPSTQGLMKRNCTDGCPPKPYTARSIRKQKSKIFQSEALRELFLSENILGQCFFMLLQIADLFLDTVFDQQAVRNDIPGLPNPMGAINCLVLNGRIPP